MLEYQKGTVEAKAVEHHHLHLHHDHHQQQMMEQHFSFYEDQHVAASASASGSASASAAASGGTILQLAPLHLPHLHPYLQLAQPNIEDPPSTMVHIHLTNSMQTQSFGGLNCNES